MKYICEECKKPCKVKRPNEAKTKWVCDICYWKEIKNK